jgi:hypothetical protein
MPRKTLKERNQPNDAKNNRIRPILDDLIGIEDPDDLMLEIIDNLQESGKVPNVGKAYVFIYNAKTPNLEYDQNPLVVVTDVFTWGFRGVNYHWKERRNYTWDEVAGQLYEVNREEFKDLQALPFKSKRMR